MFFTCSVNISAWQVILCPLFFRIIRYRHLILTCIISPALWHIQLCRTFPSTYHALKKIIFFCLKITMHCNNYPYPKPTKCQVKLQTCFVEKKMYWTITYCSVLVYIFMCLRNLRSFAHGNL